MNNRIKLFALLLIPLSLSSLPGCVNNDTHDSQGYIEGQTTYVASEVSGTLTDLKVRRGNQVTKGQALFDLELEPQSSIVKQSEAELNTAKANLSNLEKGKRPTELAAIEAQQRQIIAKLSFAKKTVDRYQHLFHTGYLEKSSLDQAMSNYHDLKSKLVEITENLKTAKLQARSDEILAARAKVASAKAALKQAKWQLSKKTIMAPVSGQVYDTFYRKGEVVPAGTPILSMLTPENITVIFFVPEEKLSRLKTGQKVKIICDGLSQPIYATISFISPKAEYTPPVIYSEKTRSKLIYRVEGRFLKEDAIRLHPGQPVSVNLDLKQKR